MSAVQLGQSAPADKVLVHPSATRFLAAGVAFHDVVNTDHTVNGVFEQLDRSDTGPNALIPTGEVADCGTADSYYRIVTAATERWHARGVDELSALSLHERQRAFSHRPDKKNPHS